MPLVILPANDVPSFGFSFDAAASLIPLVSACATMGVCVVVVDFVNRVVRLGLDQLIKEHGNR